MRRFMSFMGGFLCAGLIFGGGAVLANTDILAQLTSQIFYWNNSKIELDAYNIGGYNYVRLRDAAEIFGVNVEYDEKTDSVYLGEQPQTGVQPPTEKGKSDGKAHAREDFSQKANPDIFDTAYTRDAYNAIRQSIVDADIITAGTNENGYNPNYEYANFIDRTQTMQTTGDTVKAMNSVIGGFNGYYLFSIGNAANISNLYEYPGYAFCQISLNPKLEPAKPATDTFVEEISGLTDAEKVKRIADYVCDRIVYRDENAGGILEVFTSSSEVNGTCATYAAAFRYLCLRADLPCITVSDYNHAWNEVYAEGKWQTADMGYYDVGRPQAALFIENFQRTDENPKKTKFAKELLVPMSTK